MQTAETQTQTNRNRNCPQHRWTSEMQEDKLKFCINFPFFFRRHLRNFPDPLCQQTEDLNSRKSDELEKTEKNNQIQISERFSDSVEKSAQFNLKSEQNNEVTFH